MVEHQSRKLGVVGSNPTGGNILSLEKLEKLSSQLAGFEPTRAEPIGFQVQRLNHSATTAVLINGHKKYVEMRGIEPRAFHMQSERSTTELHPLSNGYIQKYNQTKKSNYHVKTFFPNHKLSTAISC